ncbi:MAG: iron-containing alcohol dehydrogenase, partial [Verrucomicrobia bacterium]
LPDLVSGFGRRVLLVSGRDTARFAGLVDALRAAGLEVSRESIPGEPTVDQVAAIVGRARTAAPAAVIAIGGGSVVDAGKAVAALVANTGDILDYLEVVGRGQPIEKPPLPFIAVPTTAGTGAEVTRNAVLGVPSARVKASMRHPSMLPAIALVDPALTLSVPPAVTAATGMDALTQLIEPFLCRRATPLTDALCRDGIPRVARALPVAFREPSNRAARVNLSLGALYSGLALANAGLGAVHGFAAPIGGAFPAPHGAVCAALLPHVLEANLTALRAGGTATAPFLQRFDELARLLTGRQDATAEDAVAWTAILARELQIPPLSHWGIREQDIPGLVSRARQASSMKANPVALSDEALSTIVRRAIAA